MLRNMYPQAGGNYPHGGGYNNSMNHMINQFSEMSTSSRGGRGRGGPSNAPRYPGVRMYREHENFRPRDGMNDRRGRRYSDENGMEDNYQQNNYYRGGFNGRGARGGYPPMPRGGYNQMRGGYNPRGKFQPPGPPPHPGAYNQGYPMRGGGRPNDYMGAGEWNGGYGEGAPFQERDDFYPTQISTHHNKSSERYQDDWSKLRSRDMAMESKLFKKNLSVKINFDNWKNIPVETSGTNLPDPINTFKGINLGEILENNIELCGIQLPTPVQMYSTSIVKAKRDLMACAQTGSGKTAAFLIPMLSNLFENGPPKELKDGSLAGQKVAPLALILAPTRELASQIFEMTQHLCYRSCVRPYVVYGGSNIDKCIDHLALGVEILVATPGRLIDLLNRGEISLEMIQYLILDEADRMLDMGFEKDIRTIVSDYKMPKPGNRQTLMFSATFPKSIQVLAKEFMEDYVFLTVGRVGSTNSIIKQTIDYVRKNNKLRELVKVISEEEKDRILVFVRTKADTERIQAVLKDDGFSAISIHGNKSQRMRENALNQFRNGDKNIMVATEVAARGLDIPNISHVINYDMPDTIDNYVHRIGRTGRMGNPGKATSFFSEADWHIGPQLVEILKESQQDVPQFLESKMRYTAGAPPTGQANKKTFNNNDKFGGRDYRRGPQYNTVRYSNTIKMPGAVRSFSTSAPAGFYNQVPFNHMNYGPHGYMQQQQHAYNGAPPQGGNSYNSGNSRSEGGNNERMQSVPSSMAQSQTSSGMSQNSGLIPPPLVPTQQGSNQQSGQHNYAFNQLNNNTSEGATENTSSPVAGTPSTPAPPQFPIYGTSPAVYSSQYNNPSSFSPRNYPSAGGPQFQQDLSDSLASTAPNPGLMRPFLMANMGNMASLAAGMGNMPNMAGIATAQSWTWPQENPQ